MSYRFDRGSYGAIAKKLNLPKSTVFGICQHAQQNAKKYKANDSDDNSSSHDNPSSDAGNPSRNAEQQIEVTACEELSLLDVLAAADPSKIPGRAEALTEEEKDRLVAVVKRDFETRRMALVDLQCEAELGHVSPQTVLKPQGTQRTWYQMLPRAIQVHSQCRKSGCTASLL